jgi:hypothetical protein
MGQIYGTCIALCKEISNDDTESSLKLKNKEMRELLVSFRKNGEKEGQYKEATHFISLNKLSIHHGI